MTPSSRETRSDRQGGSAASAPADPSSPDPDRAPRDDSPPPACSCNPKPKAYAFPPAETPAVGTVVEGIASWYGPGYDGKRSSSGEVFDQDALTAAHAYWAFGTRVRVTFPATGKSVVVRINEPLPLAQGARHRPSRGAAKAIGLIGPGTGEVRLEDRREGRARSARRGRRPPVPMTLTRPLLSHLLAALCDTGRSPPTRPCASGTGSRRPTWVGGAPHRQRPAGCDDRSAAWSERAPADERGHALVRGYPKELEQSRRQGGGWPKVRRAVLGARGLSRGRRALPQRCKARTTQSYQPLGDLKLAPSMWRRDRRRPPLQTPSRYRDRRGAARERSNARGLRFRARPR